MEQFTGSASPSPQERSARQQGRLLLVAAALIAGYYLAFSAVGLYPLTALATGLLIPALFSAAAWRLGRAGLVERRRWHLALATGASALALLTAALSNGTRCVGFQVVWALPLIYSLVLPRSPAAVVAGGAVGLAGGLALVVQDGWPLGQAVQWFVIALGAAVFAALRTVYDRREQRAQESEADVVTAQLSVSEERYRLLAENTHEVIWTMDPSTLRFTYVSPSILAQRGYTVDEALQQGLADALTPESLARAGAVLAKVGTPEEESPHLGIYDQPCRDGAVRHMEIRALVRRDPAGQPREVVGVSRDVTRRVEAERELRRSEERFRALVEKSSDMILLLDREGRVQLWSPGVTEVLDYPLVEVQGKTLTELGVLHPDDEAIVDGALLTLLRGERSGSATARIRHRHRPGAWRWVQAVARNFLDDPAVRGIVINARDVTDQHELEGRVQQAQKLESIGRVAGGLAHDFNNVLTVMLSCAESAYHAASEGGQVDPEDLVELRGAGERARELTRQLLAFARKQAVTPVALEVGASVRAAERLLRRVLGEQVRLELSLEAEPWTVLCDPSQLDQVLVNLAVNARDAMPRGGALTVATRNVRVAPGRAGDLREGDWVELLVRDGGVGMSAEVKTHLFEPFFTTKPRGEGTGLGLATVYGIVHQAGGQIAVESEPGLGTTFRIWLPRRDGGVETPRPASVPAVRVRGSGTVMVVEDDPLVRNVSERTLRRAGFQVVAAASGDEAVRAVEAAETPPALVVTDMVMPGMGGLEVAQTLRARLPGLRVLYVSGYAKAGVGPRELAVPHTAFLAKPFTAEALLGEVRALLDG